MEILQKKIQFLVNLYKSRKLHEAEKLGKDLIQAYPNVVFLYNILGLIFTDYNKIDDAVDIFEKGIKIKSNYAEIYNNLATAYKLNKKYILAEKNYKKSINLNNKLVEAQNNLGTLYIELNKYKEAINCFKKAININPKFYSSHYNLGVAYKSIGNFDKARANLHEAIKINPNFSTAHRTLSQIIKYTKNNNHLILLNKIYTNLNINNYEKAELAFALGKAYDDIKDYDNAFKFYKDGNYLKRKNINFTIEHEIQNFDNIRKVFNADLFKNKKEGNQSNKTIFIIGMPRSGSTLIEQILSSHPKVFGGDELNYFPEIVIKYFNIKTTDSMSESLMKLDAKKVAKEYLSKLDEISDSEKITDKMLTNFKWLGLIKILIPNSKIIHCTRNSKDICLSIFKQYFINKELNYAFDLKEIVTFYNLYSNLMNHWKKILPNFIYDIKYEEIIKNPKTQIINLLKSCDLNWNKNCLKFYNNKRPIKTASDTQVRKKIYNKSVNSWKNYEKYLKSYF